MARVGKRLIADSHFIVSTSKVAFYVDQLILGIIIREGLLNNWKQEFRSFSICNKNEGGIIKMAVVWKIVWRAKKCEINKGSHNKHTCWGWGGGWKKCHTPIFSKHKMNLVWKLGGHLFSNRISENTNTPEIYDSISEAVGSYKHLSREKETWGWNRLTWGT